MRFCLYDYGLPQKFNLPRMFILKFKTFNKKGGKPFGGSTSIYRFIINNLYYFLRISSVSFNVWKVM